MKKISVLITMCFVLAGLAAFSQDDSRNSDEIQTLFSKRGGKVDHGGYFAFTTAYSQVAGQDAFSVGGRAGWLIDHHVTVGLAGQGFVNSIYNDEYDFPPNYNGDPVESGLYFVGGYGGFFVEPIIAPKFPVHIAIPIMIGGGGAAWNYTTWVDSGWEHDMDEYTYDPYDYDAFFILEPGLEIELNLVKFLRASVGVTYRYVTDLQLEGTPKDAMNGFTGNFSLKFGKF
jgi:hypothetical protein